MLNSAVPATYNTAGITVAFDAFGAAVDNTVTHGDPVPTYTRNVDLDKMALKNSAVVHFTRVDVAGKGRYYLANVTKGDKSANFNWDRLLDVNFICDPDGIINGTGKPFYSLITYDSATNKMLTQ